MASPTRPASPPRLPGLAALVALLVVTAAQAGPLDPTRHAFERIGPGAGATAALLPWPGRNHALALRRDGGLFLVTGDGLRVTPFGTVPVDTSCAAKGLLAATWAPGAEGEVVYLTYVAADSGAFTVGRLDVDAVEGVTALVEIYAQGFGAACESLGGGLAFAADGTLLVGLGDQGDAAAAASAVARVGKIYRMTADGSFPTAPLAPNPFLPTSHFYAMGVRDPVALASDSGSDDVWFLDVGPGGAGELNLVRPLGDHGWDAAMQMGPLSEPDDPFHVWPDGTTPSGLAVYRADNLGAQHDGRLLVATRGTGALSSVTPDRATPADSTETLLFTPGAGEPASFRATAVFDDGFVHVVDASGGLHRFRARAGSPLEISRRASIVPLTVTRQPSGEVVIAAERMSGVGSYGVFVGDLNALGTAGYTHADTPDHVVPDDGVTGEAYLRMPFLLEELGPAGGDAYLLVGGSSGCAGTGLGAGTTLQRPGGLGAASGGVAVLGGGSHSLSDVDMTTVLTAVDGVADPRDVEFHPDSVGEVWVANRADNSVLIAWDPGQGSQSTQKRIGGGAEHFLAKPAALAFGPGTGYLATAHEEDQLTQGPSPPGTPEDFMGPTLWTSDSVEFEGGHASHYDMLHDSPNAVGIAWESGTAYWVVDGWHSSLTRYDFVDDHGPGGAFHGDGIVTRYAAGEFSYVPDVVSHVAHDPADGLVYFADTGRNRIAVLDPTTGVNTGPTSPNYDGATQTAVDGSTVWTVVNGDDIGMVAPAGLELHDCRLFVTDNATSMIYAFSMTGDVLDWLDTGLPPGSLNGLAFDPVDGSLYVVDSIADRVLRIAPR